MIILSKNDENTIIESIRNDYIKARTKSCFVTAKKIAEEIDQMIRINSLSEDLVLILSQTKSSLKRIC